MAGKFRNRYRIGSTRLNGYDYTRNGAYFITICTQKKIPFFGNVIGGKMILSETGIIVRDFWLKIPVHFPATHLDEFIIMPDHIHGIIIISSNVQPISESNSNHIIVETPNLGVSNETQINPGQSEETPRLGVSTGSLIESGNSFWKPKSIGSIINQFKRICTIRTKSCGLDLSWQSRFYDHIIRSDNELDRIRIYIKDNPQNW